MQRCYSLAMARTQESGAYLGGIGAMLGVADVCPSCGQQHPNGQFGIAHGGPRECPKVVMGSFPVVTPLEELELEEQSTPQTPAARRIREYEVPAPVPMHLLPFPAHADFDVRPRSLSVPWLRPPDLGEMV